MHIPFHRYHFEDAEYQAVAEVMRSGWLTTGAKVAEFENAFAKYKNAPCAVAVTSCTAALSVILATLPLQKEDEIITTPLSFASTANVIIQRGCKVVFADVDPSTHNISPTCIQQKITPKTRALIVVHLGGNACEMDAICKIAQKHNLFLIEDCAHALETTYHNQAAGTFGYAGAFSFYPNKNITTGEGGMIISANANLEHDFKLYRNHGLDYEPYNRADINQFRQYDIVAAGFKYNLTDLQAGLGICQLARIKTMWNRRAEIAQKYTQAFENHPAINLLYQTPNAKNAHHLFIIKLNSLRLYSTRDQVVSQIMQKGVQLSIHFKPIHLFSYYRSLGHFEGECPIAEDVAKNIFTLPIYPLLTDLEVDYIIETVLKALENYTL